MGCWCADGADGALVGVIDNQYFLLGTAFNGVAPKSGNLKLAYWDSNNYDNNEFIRATVTVVPEPSTYLAGLGALSLLGLSAWRNRK